MAVTVNSASASASITSVKPRVSISVTVPQAGVTYVLPVAAVDYIQLQVFAELDVRGRYKLFTEASVVLDQSVISFVKNVAEQVEASDTSNRSLDKSTSDSFGVSDVFSKLLEFIRVFAETIEISETQAWVLEGSSRFICCD